jgi:hypothetical protein
MAFGTSRSHALRGHLRDFLISGLGLPNGPGFAVSLAEVIIKKVHLVASSLLA